MIRPENPVKIIWDLILFLATSYFSIEVPLRFVLQEKQSSEVLIFERGIQILFGLDIILNFLTGYYKEKKLISSPKSIAKRYLKSWFWIDFFSFFPFDLLGETVYQYFGATDLLRVLRLLRAVKVFEMLKALQSLFHRKNSSEDNSHLEAISPVTFRLMFFIYWTGIFAHWTACGWIYLNPDFLADQDRVTKYVRSLYWSLTTLTTIGYGDITPTTNVQTVYTMCIMIIGVGIYGYVIGNVSTILSNLDVSQTSFQEKLNQVNSFLKYKKIPDLLANRVRSYYVNLWENKHGIDESDVWKDLPSSLKIDLSLFMHEDLITNVPFFKSAHVELIREVVMELKPSVFNTGDLIFRQGDIAHNMYFISKGRVEIFSEKTGDSLAQLTEGSFFGEMALLLDAPRSASVRAMSFCDIYTLSKDSFNAVIKNHPSFGNHIKSLAVERKNQQTEKLAKRKTKK